MYLCFGYKQNNKLNNMNLEPHGVNTFINNCVTNICSFGFWILIDEKEYFVPFSDYPVFKKAKIEQIINFRQLSPNQLHWQSLDCDIELSALEFPHQFPLMYQS